MLNYVLPRLITRRRRFGNLRGSLPLSDYSFWGTCPVLYRTNSGLVLSRTNYGLSAARTYSGSGAVRTHLGPVLFAPILARCCLDQSWPGAVRTHSDPVQPAPMPTKCSPHFSSPSAARTWLREGERMSVMTSSSGVPHHTPPIP